MSDAPAMRLAVVGNPNVGKTSLFNGLTGARHRVGNYAGVTVERREGSLRSELAASRGGDAGRIDLIDLPGTYSLSPHSEDEAVAFRVLYGLEGSAPDAILVVLDAANLARNLYFALQLASLRLPMVVALNMVDVARAAGHVVDAPALERLLGCPVVETVARSGSGSAELVAAFARAQPLSPAAGGGPREGGELPAAPAVAPEFEAIIDELRAACEGDEARVECLCAAVVADTLEMVAASLVATTVLRKLPRAACFAFVRARVEARYQRVDRLMVELESGSDRAASNSESPASAVRSPRSSASKGGTVAPSMVRSQQIDRVVTHRLWGPLIFVGVMALVFQSIFTWADPAIGAIESLMGAMSSTVAEWMGPGRLTDLVTEGIIAGVGNVIVFVPQIALLFAFVGLLEDSGYMARAAFIVDRVMAKVGLNGKAFVPLMSGYACAIPAIMGTRTIRRFRDRVVTILMIPFMSCSARLPIYALIIGALFDADRPVWGPFSLGGLILLSMYALSTLSALAMGAIYRRTILKGPTPELVLELPPYRAPRLSGVLRETLDRTWDFLRDAGTIILAATIVLWGLLTFPEVPSATTEATTEVTAARESGTEINPIEYSYAGRMGKAMEPVLEPIGQDWRVGIGIIGSFAAREVLVSTLGLVYGIEGADEDDAPLREQIRDATRPDGSRRYSPLSGVALMVFFVYACQCMSTLAVVKRETRSWRWPAFMFVSMSVLAYVMSLLVYQGGLWLGFG